METSDNQKNVPIITPQSSAPKRRRMARWLTLAIAVFLIGGGTVWWLVRDNKVAQAVPSATVGITTDGFVPQTIRIKKGSMITWTNNDAQAHQTASDPYPTNDAQTVINSKEALSRGDSYTATFENTGTFTYHDEMNPTGFKGTIVVE
jgi:plastocyanin